MKGYKIGMSKPMAAIYDYNEESGEVTYTEATSLGEAMTGTFNPSYAESSLHGDDEEVDNSKELKNVGISLGVTKLPIAAHKVLYGSTVTEDKEVTEKTTDTANYVGVGFISKQTDGKYTAVVFPKVKFARGQESSTTKGESVTYSTPSLTGTATGSDKDRTVRKFKEDLTEQEAIAYVEAILKPGGNQGTQQNQGTQTEQDEED